MICWTNQYVQNLVTLPDANELPDANILGTGIQPLTLAEQDCRFRMNNERCTMIIRQQDYKSQKYICSEVRVAFVRAELPELLFRDKASQPC